MPSISPKSSMGFKRSPNSPLFQSAAMESFPPLVVGDTVSLVLSVARPYRVLGARVKHLLWFAAYRARADSALVPSYHV